MPVSEGGWGYRRQRPYIAMPHYLLPTGRETLAPSVKGLSLESPSQDPAQSPKKGHTCTDRSRDRHRRAVIWLLDLAYVLT